MAPSIQSPVGSLAGHFAPAAEPPPPRKRRRRPSPFSIRLSAAERTILERDAGETPLATYIKFRIFNQQPDFRQSSRSGHPGDIQLIARLLAALGEARLANNLNQLAKAANMGTLDVTPETEDALVVACEEVRAMRRDLMVALGLKPKE